MPEHFDLLLRDRDVVPARQQRRAELRHEGDRRVLAQFCEHRIGIGPERCGVDVDARRGAQGCFLRAFVSSGHETSAAGGRCLSLAIGTGSIRSCLPRSGARGHDAGPAWPTTADINKRGQEPKFNGVSHAGTCSGGAAAQTWRRGKERPACPVPPISAASRPPADLQRSRQAFRRLDRQRSHRHARDDIHEVMPPDQRGRDEHSRIQHQQGGTQPPDVP